MVKTSKLEFTPLQHKIFRVLCIYAGKKLSLSEIARLTKSTTAGVSKASKKLVVWGIAQLDEDASINLSLLSLRLNQSTRRLKQVENLAQLYESGIVDELEESYPGTTIIVFGSYSRGEDTVRSDIDIAILGSDKESKELVYGELHRPIRINCYPQLSNIAKELRENICNGIVLTGGIEL